MSKQPPAVNVVPLHRQAAYRPDLASLARQQISSARNRLGLTHQEFAVVLAPLLGWAPSPELIEGWETQAVPPGDVVLAAGLATQRTPGDVIAVALSAGADKLVDLLSAIMGDLEKVAGSPDVVRAYATRGLITRTDWNGIIRGAQTSLWLYGMAEMGYALDDEVPEIIESAARDGCQIRVHLLDPRYSGIADIDLDEGNPPGTLAPRIRAALTRFLQMGGNCDGRMQVRLYSAPPIVSVVRGDDRMFVTPYMRFLTGGNSPTFELRDADGGNLFNRYARHFESMWRLSKEWTE